MQIDEMEKDNLKEISVSNATTETQSRFSSKNSEKFSTKSPFNYSEFNTRTTIEDGDKFSPKKTISDFGNSLGSTFNTKNSFSI